MGYMDVTSPKWWMQMFVTTFVTMIFIYLIKKMASKVNLPVVSGIVSEV